MKKILSKRKVEVFSWIAQGYCYKEVAEKLYLSQDTVNSHVHQSLKKLECRSSAQAVYKLTKAGLL
jgi:DNA-binding NarL/FixJ family response regulator